MSASVRSITPASIRLAAIERRVKAVYGFMIATAAECGGLDNPACRRMVKTTLRELLRLSAIFGRAEQRIRRHG